MAQSSLDHNFTYHKPTGPEQISRYEYLRAAAKNFAEVVTQETKPSREQSLALTKIEEAMFWANAGIARNG